MCDQFSHVVVGARRRFRTAVLCLTFVLFFASAAPRAAAQEVDFLVPIKRVPLIRTFYPERNETAIVAPVGLAEPALKSSDPSRWQDLPRNIYLWEIQYVYPGKSWARPPGVSFTFSVKQGRDKYKERQSLSVSADGTVVLSGDLVPEQRAAAGNKKPVTGNQLIVVVPTDVFLSLSRAKKVVFKLGPETFTLNSAHRKFIQALSKTIEP